ncbi:hypothetical protein LCGC14_0664700 [marine sediment metagenome]|uniref:Uncharacterized protein n=1 Tax=marine sediment metagenome TaxID=412755 RepID=A0A0F9QXN4_9ZZZZ
MRNKKRNNTRPERTTGELIWYFMFHNLISFIFFFAITVSYGLYSGNDLKLFDVFTGDFWAMVFSQIYLITLLSGIMGRVTAWLIIYTYSVFRHKTIKRWNELNTGINKIGLVFFITALVTSVVFALGLIGILQVAIFNEETLLTLIAVYSGIKIGSFFMVRYGVGKFT